MVFGQSSLEDVCADMPRRQSDMLNVVIQKSETLAMLALEQQWSIGTERSVSSDPWKI